MNALSSSTATKIALTILLLCCCCYYSSVQAFNNNNMLLSRNNAIVLGRYKSSEVPRFLFGKTADADATTTTTKDKNKTGFLGRFRKKKNIIQDEILIGSTLPDIDVGIIGMKGDDNDSNVVSMKELFGGGGGNEGGEEETTKTKPKTIQILVGMPGAFTPSCTNVHLPGFKNSLSKLQHLGVDTIAIVTTNDRFVNEAWGNDLGIISTDEKDDDIDDDDDDDDDDKSSTTTDDGSDNGVEDKSIIMLSDGDAELVRAIGLAEDMGTFLQLHTLSLFVLCWEHFFNKSHTSFGILSLRHD
jgi:peroxiredoxin